MRATGAAETPTRACWGVGREECCVFLLLVLFFVSMCLGPGGFESHRAAGQQDRTTPLEQVARGGPLCVYVGVVALLRLCPTYLPRMPAATLKCPQFLGLPRDPVHQLAPTVVKGAGHSFLFTWRDNRPVPRSLPRVCCGPEHGLCNVGQALGDVFAFWSPPDCAKWVWENSWSCPDR